jgi:hypothetical protein
MDVVNELCVRFHFGGEFCNDGKNCSTMEATKHCHTLIEIKFLYQWVTCVTIVQLLKEHCCIGCFLERNRGMGFVFYLMIRHVRICLVALWEEGLPIFFGGCPSTSPDTV